jgi:hypothetical protein
MSDTTRYEVEGCMEPSNEGCFVMWSDYKKLKAENERIKRELECAELNWRRQYEDRAEMGKKMQFWSDDRMRIIKEQSDLADKNERLREAGDAMYDFAVQDSMGIWVMPPFDKWSKEFHSKNNAKGVQNG